MTLAILPELDEVEGLDVRGEVEEVRGEDYDVPLAKALQALTRNPELSTKAWLDEGLEEVFVAFDLSDKIEITEEHKDILRSRDVHLLHAALLAEREAAGVPNSFVFVWALVRI